MAIADKLTVIADNMPKVFEAGRKAEWNKFWDDFQDFGNRTAYNNGFQNAWTDDIFQPKYDIRPTTASYMFAGTRIANLKECLEKGGVDGKGVTLDTSNSTSLDYMFSNAANLTHCPVISGVKESYFTSTFYNCKKLISIDKLILKEDGTQTFSNDCFNNCGELVDIDIEGVIGNTINFQWLKKLSVDSLNSINNALSTTVSGKTITFPSSAKGKITEKSNWTYAYL
jgi:hypothetical protein